MQVHTLIIVKPWGLKLDTHSVSCRAVSLEDTRVNLLFETWCAGLSFHICRDLYVCRCVGVWSASVTEVYTAVSLTVSCAEETEHHNNLTVDPQHHNNDLSHLMCEDKQHRSIPSFCWVVAAKYDCINCRFSVEPMIGVNSRSTVKEQHAIYYLFMRFYLKMLHPH